MVTTNQALGRFIALAHHQRALVTNASITQAIEDLVDIIKLRLQERDLAAVGNSVLEKLFSLRFRLLDFYIQQDLNIDDYHQEINQAIANKLQLASFSTLAETVALVLSLQEKIATPITSSLNKKDINQAIHKLSNQNVSYNFVQLFYLHPSPRVQYLKKWVDTSLQLEFGLLVADLVLRDSIKLSINTQNELNKYLKDTIVRYGACCIFTGFWKPKESEVYASSWVNKMEILNACWEVDHSLGETYNLEELANLVTQ